MNQTPHILVVDDEPDYLQATVQLLQLEGFRATGACSGADALQQLSQPDTGEVDVYLIDFRMPGLNGGETLNAIRASGKTGCAVLVSAAHEIARIAQEFRFDYQLRKPCDVAELLDVIRRCTECEPRSVA